MSASETGDPKVLSNCGSSEWHHMQCGHCAEWWAVEGTLKQAKYFCPHCGSPNLLIPQHFAAP